MPTDIFSGVNATKIAGGLRLNGATLLGFTAGGTAVGGMLVQNYNIAYQQQVTKLRALNTDTAFVVVAPPNGQCTIASAISDGNTYLSFVQTFSDACKVVSNILHFTALTAICADRSFKIPDLTLKGCLVSQIQLSQNIQDLVLNSNMQIDFISFERGEADVANGAPPNGA
jgi:hypothetical protein